MKSKTMMIWFIVITVVFVLAAGSWWFVFLNDNILFSEEQLDYFMGWGVLSNLGIGVIAFGWFIFFLSWIAQTVSKRDSK